MADEPKPTETLQESNPDIKLEPSQITLNNLDQQKPPNQQTGANTGSVSPQAQPRLSPIKENKLAEKMYKMMYTTKDPRSRKPAELTEVGRQLLAATKIKEDTILKLELDHFES